MKSKSPFKIEAHDFSASDFVGGDPAIDFVNTVTGRDVVPRDWLDGYGRLVEWAQWTQLLPASALRRLAAVARREPLAADAALARAKRLREQLFDMLSAIAAGKVPSRQSLALLREQWIAGAKSHELAFEQRRVVAVPARGGTELDDIAAIIAYRLVEGVLSAPLGRLRMCSGRNCAWLFIDTSKAGRRRWCDMATCGNVAKSRRHYARTRSK